MLTRFKEWRDERWRNKHMRLGTDAPKPRGYRFFQVGFFTLLIAMGILLYASYDYWVFRVLVTRHYIFTETLDELYDMHLWEENRTGLFRDFDRVMISVFTQELTALNQDRFTYLYAPQAHRAVREMDEYIARRATVQALSPDTVYLWVPNVSPWSRQFVQQHAAYLSGYRNLVLDLRYNYGGLLTDMRRLADMFLPRGAVVSIEETRLRLTSRTVTSRGRPVFDFDQIIILQNRFTASAAEGLIMALEAHLPGLVTLGETTSGKGIGQITWPLTGGYTVRATTLLVKGPDGNSIHQTGLAAHMPGEGDWVAQALGVLGY